MGDIIPVGLLILTAIANITLGLMVYNKNRKSNLHRFVLCLTISICFYCFTIIMILLNHEYDALLFWIRAAHVPPIFISWSIFGLSFAFPRGNPFSQRKVMFFLLFSVLISVLCFTPLMVDGVKEPLSAKEKLFGPLFSLFTVYYLYLSGYSFLRFYRMIKTTRGLARNQLRYFAGGIIVSLSLGILSNLFLPIIRAKFMMDFQLGFLGPIFSLIMVVSISYAIIKFRLMDIRLAVRKGLAFLVTITIIAAGVLLLLRALEMFGVPLVETSHYVLVGLAVILMSFLFQPLRSLFQRLVDTYLYAGSYDYYSALIKSSKNMLSYLQLHELLHYFVSNIVEKMILEGGCFYLRQDNGLYTLEVVKKSDPDLFSKEAAISPGSPLLLYLKEIGDVLLHSDLAALPPGEKREALEKEAEQLCLEAVVPIMAEGELEGFLILAPKLSGEPFTEEDIDLFLVLSYQVAIALKNARLYHEVLNIKVHLENILSNMGNGLIAIDARGRITTFNGTAEIYTGKKTEDVLYKRVDYVLDPLLSMLLLQALEEERGISEAELEISSNLVTRHLCCNIVFIKSLETEENSAIMVMSDLSRIKELEQEKSQVQKLASLGELAAGVAHEIKNPLVSIKTFAELLPERYEHPEFRYEFSRIVIDEIERINSLVKELLSLSVPPRLNYSRVDICALLDEVVILLLPQIKSQVIRVYRVYDESLPHIRVDRNQMKQAFFNICLNGVQAMPLGGQLRLQVRACDNGSNHKNYKQQEDFIPENILILISDTGTGIAHSQANRIFDPFFTTKVDGVGLGLSLSYRIISDHGGNIDFYSNNGEGTVFEICLPVTGEPAEKLEDLFRERS